MNSIDDNTTEISDNATLKTLFKSECKFDYGSSDDKTVASIPSNSLHIEPKAQFYILEKQKLLTLEVLVVSKRSHLLQKSLTTHLLPDG